MVRGGIGRMENKDEKSKNKCVWLRGERERNIVGLSSFLSKPTKT